MDPRDKALLEKLSKNENEWPEDRAAVVNALKYIERLEELLTGKDPITVLKVLDVLTQPNVTEEEKQAIRKTMGLK